MTDYAELANRYLMLIEGGPPSNYSAWSPDLPGCVAVGETPDEAVRRIQGAIREWLADAAGKDRKAPKPRAASSHSGRLLIRMPPALHAELARAAERREVSLNQFITTSLATAVRSHDGEKLGGTAPGGAAEQPAPARSRALVANLVLLAIIAALALALIAIAVSRL